MRIASCAALVALAAGLGGAAGAARAQCPSSSTRVCDAVVHSVLPVYETVRACANGWTFAGWDMPSVMAWAHAYDHVWNAEDTWLTSAAAAREQFVLEGPAHGGPLTLGVVVRSSARAASRFDGYYHRWGRAVAGVRLEAGGALAADSVAVSSQESREETLTVAIQIQVSVGAGFFVHWTPFVRLHPPSRAYADGRIDFATIPPGYRVRSCRGFETSLPVSAGTPSWARLKRLYR